VDLRWVKVRRKCGNQECLRKTFTESVPALPPRCRITARLGGQAAGEIAERGITPAEAARHAGVSWPVVHEALAAAADPIPDQDPAPVTHLGIDEHRRGRARFAVDEQTGEYTVLADRWHTCFFDLSASRGCWGRYRAAPPMTPRTGWPVQPRPGGTRSGWPASTCVASTPRRCAGYCRTPPSRWTCSTSCSSPSRPSATCAAGWSAPGTGAPAGPATPSTASRACWCGTWNTCPRDQFAKIIGTLDRDRYGQEIAAAWIAKEKLRDALNLRARVTGSTPCERAVRDRLFSFYDWCTQHDDIPELVTLARTISRWEDEITAAVITGITNATSESLNRLAKLEARLAYGSRNPLSQRRRVRIACTRGYRRRSRAAIPSPKPTVTGRQPDPG
jgi:transposase